MSSITRIALVVKADIRPGFTGEIDELDRLEKATTPRGDGRANF